MSTEKLTEITERVFDCSVCKNPIADGAEYITIEVCAGNCTSGTIILPRGLFFECLLCYQTTGIPSNILDILVAGVEGTRSPIPSYKDGISVAGRFEVI